MAVEVFSQLLAATDASQLGQRITEQLRELTGARTAMVIIHRDAPHTHELLHASPPRREVLFSAADLDQLCPENVPEPLPCRPADFPSDHPLRARLLQSGVESLLRVPLHAGGRLVGMLLLLDLPALDRIGETTRIATHLSPVLALALRNALAHRRIEQQAQQLDLQMRGLEQRVAERTAELKAANETLVNSRLAALNLMEDAIEARQRAEQTAAALQEEVTERKRAEAEIRKLNAELEQRVADRTRELAVSEERMRLFFERQLMGSAITSPEKGWLQVNDKLCQMLGYAREELMRMNWAELTYPEDLAADVAQFERLLRGEIDSYMIEKRFVRKDGSLVVTNLAVGCVRRPDRSVDYVLELLEDITERKHAEENIQKLNGELQQRARELEAANLELQRMNKLFVGRELRMVELKQRIALLEKMPPETQPRTGA
jgi:PAS domain S-box-containing protein